MERKARYAALCDRARTLITFFEKRAERTEELRQLPPETLRDLHETGLFRLLQPEALSGASAHGSQPRRPRSDRYRSSRAAA
jgi:alkylation response protein AidB-like acyl-CoA dehydrogenase